MPPGRGRAQLAVLRPAEVDRAGARQLEALQRLRRDIAAHGIRLRTESSRGDVGEHPRRDVRQHGLGRRVAPRGHDVELRIAPRADVAVRVGDGRRVRPALRRVHHDALLLELRRRRAADLIRELLREGPLHDDVCPAERSRVRGQAERSRAAERRSAEPESESSEARTGGE